ncbi:MAG: hypothetical protein WC502_09540, partial [Methanolinea sp.]
GMVNYTLCNETSAIWRLKGDSEQILARIETEVRDMETRLEEKKGVLDARKSSLEAFLSVGDTGGYNRGVAAYNAEVSQYNQMRADLLTRVERFNRIAEVHNFIVTSQHDRKGIWEWYLTFPGL